jgi:hypothetical protein
VVYERDAYPPRPCAPHALDPKCTGYAVGAQVGDELVGDTVPVGVELTGGGG